MAAYESRTFFIELNAHNAGGPFDECFSPLKTGCSKSLKLLLIDENNKISR